MAGGRPTKYNPSYHPIIVELAARNGMTDKDIASKIGVTEKTLNTWKQKHPEFLQSLKKGKEEPDECVKSMLYRNAIGYEEEDVKIFCDKGVPVYAPYIKKHKPDVTSQIFWLKNRDPKNWREKLHIEDDTDFSRQKEKLSGLVKDILKSE